MPEPDNASVLAQAPYNLPRRGKRMTNAQEGDWHVRTMKRVERQQTRLAVMDLVLPV